MADINLTQPEADALIAMDITRPPHLERGLFT